MTDALPVLRALPIAALDLAVGAFLYWNVAEYLGVALVALGMVLLATAAVQAVRVVGHGHPDVQ